MQRSAFIGTLSAAVTTLPLTQSSVGGPLAIAGINIPDSALAREATEISRGALPPEIFNHCLRTYLFAELIAAARRTPHDAEAVYVTAILHDMGLSAKHMSEGERFEVDGANLSRELLHRHGHEGRTSDVVWDAIALHDNGGIARWKQSEVVLVNAGVSADFGEYLTLMSREQIIAVLAAAPRKGFVPVFLAATAEMAKRKPFATGTCFVTDVANRMVPAFHTSNVCDVVKDDPFAAYGA